MASAWYNKGKEVVANGAESWLTSTIKIMLLNASFAFNADHLFASSINANELSGTGYTAGFGGAGRKTLAGKAVVRDDANDRAEMDASDVTWTAINAGTAAWAVLVVEKTSDADSPILAALDLSPDVVTNGGDLTLQWDAEGILQLT